MWWLAFFGALAAVYVWSEWDVRGSEAQRLLDRFRVPYQKPLKDWTVKDVQARFTSLRPSEKSSVWKRLARKMRR